jgi:hypothetical protein
MKIHKFDGDVNGIKYTFVEFKPFGTFTQKLNTILKAVHLRLLGELITKIKSKKRVRTFLSSLIAKKPKDVLMIYKYGTLHGHTYVNKKGIRKNTQNDKFGQRQVTAFKIISQLYSFTTTDKLTPENLVRTAVQDIIDRNYEYQITMSDESEPWPLYSITFKFLL